MQFVKLFNSILDSTIWQESKETKLVWITMMAMSDRNGEIHASIPGLASRSGVTLAESEAALTCLMSPDAYSRTKTDEGRRIAVIDGGWRLLNHGKYRALLSAEERKEYNRVKQQQHRAAMKDVNDRSMTISNVSTVQSQSQSQSTESEAKKRTQTKESPAAPDGFEEFWTAYPNKTAKAAALKAWSKIKPDLTKTLQTLQWQRRSDSWTKDNGQFIPHASTYLNNRRFEDEPKRSLPTPSVTGASYNGHRSCL